MYWRKILVYIMWQLGHCALGSQESAQSRASMPSWLQLPIRSQISIQVESGAFTHLECDDAACFPVRNWRILHTEMKGRCWCSTTANFRGDRFSSVLENQMQIWWTNFGVWLSHWLFPDKYNIPWEIRLHRTSPKHNQGSLREDLAVEYSRCYSFLVT